MRLVKYLIILLALVSVSKGQVRLHCGGESLYTIGGVWMGDLYYTGGEKYNTGIREGGIVSSLRFGLDFAYDVPLSQGNYRVNFYFAEVTPNVVRGFDVEINGVPFLKNVDIVRETKVIGVMLVKSVIVNYWPEDDGVPLRIRFVSRNGKNALVSGIEIIPIKQFE